MIINIFSNIGDHMNSRLVIAAINISSSPKVAKEMHRCLKR